MEDRYNAYVDRNVILEPSGSGVLSGKTFSVKDVFSVKGYKNTAGNPVWLHTHQPAAEHAPVIQRLLNEGAAMHGMTHTDELMYSLNGENIHYGTPVNPKAEERIPGGSSSGSAVAVAAQEVDFALGTDTGGSVRIPSSYCGIYGFRPTHGTVSVEGVIPLASSFDTVGWMARSSQLLEDIGEVLLTDQKEEPFSRLVIGRDAWDLLLPEAENAFSNVISELSSQFETTRVMTVARDGLDHWFQTFKYLQAQEIWQEHGGWIKKEQPVFGPDIGERFSWAGTLENQEFAHLAAHREYITKLMDEILKQNAVLAIPTVPGGAPKRGTEQEKLQDLRSRTMQLSCIAGLAGLPQITLPLGHLNTLPIGISLLAGRGGDRRLLSLANRFVSAMSDDLVEKR
ncbi:amidase [Halobacillus sp. Marseille-P3879]|uniref:amidase n=1 Tax=Halobacillus sp. Marseille-P3879 TaxID=2045014 RepID=UPI000C79F381|nr:amidase [Halobacillus sp. Marseille-P3879]